MDRLTERRGRAGLSLVELLVVLAMIGVLSAVLVPLAVRGGWGSGSKTAFAARDVFTLLKAARVYASTHNVETALVYGGNMVQDSEIAGNPCVPIIDSVMLARRIKREEMIRINQFFPGTFTDLGTSNVFVPITTADGGFRILPKQMVVLPDVFTVQDVNGQFISRTGLYGVQVYEPDAAAYLEPRTDTCEGSTTQGSVLDYSVDSLGLSFPAHRFQPDGSVRVDDGIPQRLRFRIGSRPDMTYQDRFYTNPESDVLTSTDVPTRFADSAGQMIPMPFFDDGIPETNDYPDVDVWLEVFVPTGRVKLLP